MHAGYYLTGDNARRDKDGYYWITGRADDVVIVSGTLNIVSRPTYIYIYNMC